MTDIGAQVPTAEAERPAGLRVFLNYRRGDSAGHAGRLYDSLTERFGDERVFMDVDKIAPGTDYIDEIDRAVGSCDVLLAVIGRDWLSAQDATGRRRLDDPNDFVRAEIEAALKRNVRLIPLLVQGAQMPDGEDLPGSLAKIARRNALELSDSRWNYDVDRLEQALRTVHEQLSAARSSAPAADKPEWQPTVRAPAPAAASTAGPTAAQSTAPTHQAAALPPTPRVRAGGLFRGPTGRRNVTLAGIGALVVVVALIVVVASGGSSPKPNAGARSAHKGAVLTSSKSGRPNPSGTGPCGRSNLNACFPSTVNGGSAAPPVLPTAKTGPGTQFVLSDGAPTINSSAKSALGAVTAVTGTYTATGKQELVTLAMLANGSAARVAFTNFEARESGQGCQSYLSGGLTAANGRPNGSWHIFSCPGSAGQGAAYFLDDGTIAAFTGLSPSDTLRFFTAWAGNGSGLGGSGGASTGASLPPNAAAFEGAIMNVFNRTTGTDSVNGVSPKVTSVDCPAGVTAQAGATFRCGLAGPGQLTGSVNVIVTSAQGAFTYTGQAQMVAGGTNASFPLSGKGTA